MLVFITGSRVSNSLLRTLQRELVKKRIANYSTKSSDVSNIADFRKEYSRQGLVESDEVRLGGPFELFKRWLKEAIDAKVIEPNAMCLSTVNLVTDSSANPVARPSSRYVLLKGFDERGFVWYTNYNSRKAGELQQNTYAALTFFWADLERSVRVEGIVEKTSNEESDAYFHSRPIGSQIGAWSSNQSSEIGNREALEEQEREIIKKFNNNQGVIPRPPHWGGYRLIPDRVEFWKGRESRLHDRLVFTRKSFDVNDKDWKLVRLQP